jgi:hypothetical protein
MERQYQEIHRNVSQYPPRIGALSATAACPVVCFAAVEKPWALSETKKSPPECGPKMGPVSLRMIHLWDLFAPFSGSLQRCSGIKSSTIRLNQTKLAQQQLRLLTQCSTYTPVKLTPENRSRFYMRLVFM